MVAENKAVRHKGRTLVLDESTLKTSWASIHEDEAVNQDQGRKLAENIAQAKAQYIREAVTAHLGHTPAFRKAERYLRIVQDDKDESLFWVYWRKTAIAVYTAPKSRVENLRYYLFWHWKSLV